MILVRLRNNKDPKIIIHGNESELIKEIHKRNLCDYHDAYFYERGKFENLGLSSNVWDYYTIYESKEEMINLNKYEPFPKTM